MREISVVEKMDTTSLLPNALHITIKSKVLFSVYQSTYSLSTVKALLSLRGAYLILDTPERSLLERGLIREVGLIQKVR